MMASHIYKCTGCGAYTMQKSCPKCGMGTVIPRPPKYSPEDRYSQYRREAKKEKMIKEGLI